MKGQNHLKKTEVVEATKSLLEDNFLYDYTNELVTRNMKMLHFFKRGLIVHFSWLLESYEAYSLSRIFLPYGKDVVYWLFCLYSLSVWYVYFSEGG